MFKYTVPTGFIILLLGGCATNYAPPYERDKSPESRTEYNGIKGLAQKQKDQNYLMSLTLQRQCDTARIDLAVAKSTGDEYGEQASQAMIQKTCVRNP
ncbi:hypothetical protein [Alteromonas sp. AMM-1]|uniref:hypothetical protein n=1 Tax=Alteromonas sp. AMM-1 TaxID=3394233 RepID=UPI0039A4CF3A